MAGSPGFKVYVSKTYQAATKEIEAAAALCAFYGPGALIKYGHSGTVLWTEGVDGEAAESYDAVAEKAQERIEAEHAKLRAARDAREAEYRAKQAGRT